MPEPMDVGEFNAILYDFGEDTEAITVKLFQATKGRLSHADVDAAISAGKAKIAAYEILLNDDRFSELRRSQILKRLGEAMDDIRGFLKQLTDHPET